MNTRFSYNQLGCSLIKALWLKPADPELLLLHQGPGFLSLHVVLVGQSALHGLHGSFCCLCKQITCRERRVGEGGQRRHQWFLRTIKKKKKKKEKRRNRICGNIWWFHSYILRPRSNFCLWPNDTRWNRCTTATMLSSIPLLNEQKMNFISIEDHTLHCLTRKYSEWINPKGKIPSCSSKFFSPIV